MRKIINEQIVKVRKEQPCYGCGRKFSSGSSMNSCFASINKIPKRIYFCKSCNHVMMKYNLDLPDFWYGELFKDALEYEKKQGM